MSFSSNNKSDIVQYVKKDNNQAITTSLLVAKKFGKRHDNVLAAIDALEVSSQFRLLNFKESSYKNKKNMRLRMFAMTKDGFTMLVMGFTGAQAAKFKEEYIAEFNRMEVELKCKPYINPIPIYTQRILSKPTRDCPEQFWNVFDQSHEVMLLIESEIGSFSKYDLADASIGARWAKYRELQPWAKDFSYYTHQFTDERGSKQAKCYDYSELVHFKHWLRHTYIPLYLIDYLRSKYDKPEQKHLIDRIDSLQQQLPAKN